MTMILGPEERGRQSDEEVGPKRRCCCCCCCGRLWEPGPGDATIMMRGHCFLIFRFKSFPSTSLHLQVHHSAARHFRHFWGSSIGPLLIPGIPACISSEVHSVFLAPELVLRRPSFRISVWPHKLLVSRRSSVRVQVAWGLLNPPLTGKPIPPISIHTLESRQCANFWQVQRRFHSWRRCQTVFLPQLSIRIGITGLGTLIILLPWFNYYGAHLISPVHWLSLASQLGSTESHKSACLE